MTPNGNLQERIKHIFVVMLENRSFDHMLGLSNIKGIDAISGQSRVIEGLNASNNWNLDSQGNKVIATSPADWTMPYDPGHEFGDVREQLCGEGGNYPHINNSGFVTRYSEIDSANPGEIMKCYDPDQLPVITALAREFALCDHWFSSMPGPTWPNRFFVHAASSAWLDHSPQPLTIAESILLRGYTFEHGTIYDRLDTANLGWTIYKGDAFPQALAIRGMNIRALEESFRDFQDFSSDIDNPGYDITYTFIEPNYGHALVGDFTCGNSQHPKDDVTRGDGLLKTIYETIRNSPHWGNSVLIVTYDEHGGFYDHVPPPQTVAPGDAIADPGNNITNFDFTQLGVRVPAVIISPLIPRGIIDSTDYDHTSVLATVESIFGLQPLTERDKHASALNHLFSLPSPRTDAPTVLPAAANSGFKCDDEIEESAASRQLITDAAAATEPVPSSLQGFLHLAFLRDLQATPPEEQASRTAKYLKINTHLDAKRYMHEVRQKVEPSKAK
jgi:phospholipase C